MRSPLRSFILLLPLVLFAACASRSGDGTPSPDNRVITKAQIRERHFLNAFEAVRALHPNWLQTKGIDSFVSPSRVLVYFDNSRLGGVEELRALKSDGIEYIRYYDGTQAATRWGLDHGAGVIFVSSRPNGAL